MASSCDAACCAAWLRRGAQASDEALPILDYVKLTKENQDLSARLNEMERKYATAVSLTQKVQATIPKAARLSASLRSPTRTGLRA